MQGNYKFAESVKAKDVNDGNPATWVKMDQAREYCVVARAGTASPADDVTIQLRKATSSGGAGAVNHGAAVTAAGFAAASALAQDLGVDGSNVQYTHVSAVVSDETSPNAYSAVAFLMHLRGG